MITTWSNNWMSGISDNTNLSGVSIPGTHESGARRSVGDSQCQWYGIIEQLRRGTRFLDIRCNYEAPLESGQTNPVYFPVYHGIANMYLTFEEVQAQCVAFLDANPSECILMNVQKNDDSDGDKFGAKFLQIIAPYENYWYQGQALPTIAAVRKHIVLIRSYDTASGEGWGKNLSNGIVWNGFDINGVSGPPKSSIYTQNKWEDTNGTEKGALAEQYVLMAKANAQKGNLTLNFLSHTDNKTPGKNAQDMNNRIKDFLKASSTAPVGVIALDFAGNTGDTGDSLENKVIEKQPYQKPDHMYGGLPVSSRTATA